MNNSTKKTPRQYKGTPQIRSDLLCYIRESIKFRGVPPSRREIMQKFGWASTNAVKAHLKSLEADGYIYLVPFKARGIRLL
jgi:repressor LexA